MHKIGNIGVRHTPSLRVAELQSYYQCPLGSSPVPYREMCARAVAVHQMSLRDTIDFAHELPASRTGGLIITGPSGTNQALSVPDGPPKIARRLQRRVARTKKQPRPGGTPELLP